MLGAATLEVAEAALTGESLPVGKGTELVEAPDAPLGDRTDMVYMNTNVAPDGKMSTSARIQVSKDGVKPPQ